MLHKNQTKEKGDLLWLVIANIVMEREKQIVFAVEEQEHSATVQLVTIVTDMDIMIAEHATEQE